MKLKSIEEILNTATVNMGVELGPLEAGETVIGTLTDDSLKALFCKRVQTYDAIEALEKNREEANELERVEIAQRISELQARYSLINEMFWFSVKAEFGLFGKDGTVGICEGWQVAYAERQRRECPHLIGSGMLVIGVGPNGFGFH